MPSITAIPHAMLIDSTEPLALPLSTVWATTPTPKAIRIRVPKNSAAASRAVPLSMRGILSAFPYSQFVIRYSLFVIRYFLFCAQHNNVLPRQHVDHAVEHESLGLELLLHLGDAHLVHFKDRHLRIFLPEFEQHQPPAGLESRLEPLQEHLRLLQLVIHVDHDREIDRVGRQLRIVHSAKHRRHVRKALGLSAAIEQVDHP